MVHSDTVIKMVEYELLQRGTQKVVRLLCLLTCGTSSDILREVKYHLRPVEEVSALVKSSVHAWVTAHDILVEYHHNLLCEGLWNYLLR